MGGPVRSLRAVESIGNIVDLLRRYVAIYIYRLYIHIYVYVYYIYVYMCVCVCIYIYIYAELRGTAYIYRYILGESLLRIPQELRSCQSTCFTGPTVQNTDAQSLLPIP